MSNIENLLLGYVVDILVARLCCILVWRWGSVVKIRPAKPFGCRPDVGFVRCNNALFSLFGVYYHLARVNLCLAWLLRC